MRQLKLFFFLLCLVSYQIDFAQSIEEKKRIAEEEATARLKSIYIYTFTRYIEWDEQYKLKEFTIGVLGNNGKLKNQLDKLSEVKSFNDLPIRIKAFKTIDEIKPTQILYVNGDDGFDQEKLFKKIKGKGTLLVAENLENFKLSMINFIEKDNKQKFSLNKINMENENFQIHPSLLELAIKDETKWRDIYSEFKELLKTDKDKIEVNSKDLKRVLSTYENQKKEISDKEISLMEKQQQISEKESSIKEKQEQIKIQEEKLNTLSVNNEVLSKNIDAKMQTLTKQEREIEDQKNILKTQLSEIQKQRMMLYMFIGVIILVLSLVFFIYRSYSLKKKANIIITQQKEEVEKAKIIIEEKNKDITDSITYAKRIQQAKLPKQEEIISVLPQSFILFKPKDIVSGDFYFFHKKNNNLAFIAAADCTGHGVPGAFMSLIGSERLEDAVYQNDDTSEILKQLNKGVKSSLRQTDSNESTRDGMDIAICSIDTNNRIVKYAGAYRPIWIIRKGQSEVEEIKATKKAIGGFTEDNQHFETHELKLEIGDTFYISTDGYADMFGASGKKLMTKKFKEILLGIQEKSMNEQKNYLDKFAEDWKAGIEQVDDILVIGVRF